MSHVFAVVTYGLPEGSSQEEAFQMFRGSIPRYMATEGMLRKNVLYREGLGGGAYLWESREAAERAFNAEWKTYMTDKYGHPPVVEFYESPITMDREHGSVYDEGAVNQAAE